MDASEHSIDALIDRAYHRVQALFDYYQLSADDFPLFQRESPKLLETIAKLEDTGILSYEDMKTICHKWVENHHLLFKRRAWFRRSPG